jgi:hypothetical protein
LRRLVLAMMVMGLMVALMATPAFAFHHGAIPADECAPAQAGVPGNNVKARAAIEKNQALPIPPAGEDIAVSPVVGPGATCPA